jgi:hypothetical protein
MIIINLIGYKKIVTIWQVINNQLDNQAKIQWLTNIGSNFYLIIFSCYLMYSNDLY